MSSSSLVFSSALYNMPFILYSNTSVLQIAYSSSRSYFLKITFIFIMFFLFSKLWVICNNSSTNFIISIISQTVSFEWMAFIFSWLWARLSWLFAFFFVILACMLVILNLISLSAGFGGLLLKCVACILAGSYLQITLTPLRQVFKLYEGISRFAFTLDQWTWFTLELLIILPLRGH